MDEAEQFALYQKYQQSGDTRLIAPPNDTLPNVQFRFGGGWRECRIWEGYLDASLLLLKAALEESPRADNLIFPALFNLRHAMEVALKWHIHYADGVVPKDARHDLKILVETFRATKCYRGSDVLSSSDFILDTAIELTNIDPRSVSFRYSTDIDGSPIEITPDSWDLLHLYFVVSDLGVCLDALSGWIDRSRDEFQAELPIIECDVGHESGREKLQS